MEANYFTILYWFCRTSTWIRHRCTHVPHSVFMFKFLSCHKIWIVFCSLLLTLGLKLVFFFFSLIIWEPPHWNVKIRGGLTPSSTSVFLAGSMLQVTKIHPVFKSWEMCFSTGWSCLANTDGLPKQVKLECTMCEQLWCPYIWQGQVIILRRCT